MADFRNIEKLFYFVFLSLCVKVLLLNKNNLSHSEETKITCYNFSIKPPWNNFQLMNFTSNYKKIIFEDCSIEFVGKDFYNLFPSAEELLFSNCRVNFSNEKHKVIEAPTNSKVKRLSFYRSILGKNYLGYGFSSIINLESLQIYYSKLYYNEFQISYAVKLKL